MGLLCAVQEHTSRRGASSPGDEAVRQPGAHAAAADGGLRPLRRRDARYGTGCCKIWISFCGSLKPFPLWFLKNFSVFQSVRAPRLQQRRHRGSIFHGSWCGHPRSFLSLCHSRAKLARLNSHYKLMGRKRYWCDCSA